MSETPAPIRLMFDADLDAWNIDFEPPGPAGTVAVQVSPGMRLLVDIAEPSRIGAIVTSDRPGDLLDAADGSAATTIFGDTVLDELGSRRSIALPRRSQRSPDELAEVRKRLARLGIAADTTIDTIDATVGAVARAEAALLSEILRDNWHLVAGDASSTSSAAQRFISAYPTILERITDSGRDALRDLMFELASFTPTEVAAQLRSLAEGLGRSGMRPGLVIESGYPKRASVGRLEFDDPRTSAPSGRLRLDRRLFSPALLDPSARAEFTWHPSAGDLTVRCRGARGAYLAGLRTHWVRAYRPDTRTVLALAPLEPVQPTGNDQFGEATLHIGSQDPATLAVDVTDAPHQPPASVLRLTLEEAARIGRDAARLERAGAPAAIAAWEACAQTWQATDDQDRQAIALARAANLALAAGRGEQAAALFAQQARLPLTWATHRLDPRPTTDPLVADLLVSGSLDATR